MRRLLALLVQLGLWSAAAAFGLADVRQRSAVRVTVADGAEEAAKQYDPKMAKALAALAKLVYCGPLNGTALAILRSTEAVMQEAGLRLADPRPVTHADLAAPDADFAVVSRFTALDGAASHMPARGCVIAFRGTDNEANNVENSRQRLEDWDSGEGDPCRLDCQVCEGCQVFGGYKAIWRELRPGVLRELQRLGCQSGDPLLLTGHNLGAGLMTLAMYSLKSQDAYDVRLSYNFASPRVGNLAFARSFNRIFGRHVALFRVTHDNDGVPHYPADPAYAHVGNQVWYPHNDAEEYTVCANGTVGRDCGNDGIVEERLCPLSEEGCKGDGAEACRANCGFPPLGGPHCVHPLAPADSFCSFSGGDEELMLDTFERSCVWGRAAPMTTAAPTIPGHVACQEEDLAWQPLDMSGTGPTSAETAAACQELCHQTEGCEHFTFFPGVRSCHRQTKEAYEMRGMLGTISGPRACSDDTGMEAKFFLASRFSEWRSQATWSTLATGLTLGVALALFTAGCFLYRSVRTRRSKPSLYMRVAKQRDGTVRKFLYELVC